jgi:hypothetical protein
MQFSKTTVAPFIQLEVYTRGLKSMKMNLNIIEPLWSVLETRVRNGSPSATSLKPLEHVLQGGHKIPLETVHNSYESIPRRIVAVMKTRGGPALC